ncbi:Tetracycline repressor protein class E [Corynebacterium atrinae]|uniref:TetR family transcriptional regulator n=1 Tax=Corynebacterium atrinae TaxID=1336740 RepID=UPI0025B3E21E|nr:TetR family transcriptional regulator [Corynebacterium atrinae]WJY63775.1 Tetracycline repressor protein class E [Corynebacterium atrinae]
MQLTRTLIVAAALDILDSYGLADMTMRRVASQLEVAPGALYWHFANKQQLISAIADQILVHVLNGDTLSTPEEITEQLRTALLLRRDGAELVSAALSMPDSQTRADVEKLLASSLDPALDADTRRIGAATLLHFVLGAAALEQSQRQFAFDTGTSIVGLDQAQEDFARGVDLILAGLSQRPDSAAVT